MIAINAQILEDIYVNDQAAIDAIIARQKAEVDAFRQTPNRIVNRVVTPMTLSPTQQDYLDTLLGDFEDIVRANTNDLTRFEGIFRGIISGAQMRTTANKAFRNELIKRMGYTDLRDHFYPDYFEKVGIKSCVYCNSQLALTVRNVDGEKSAKFQVDHFLPKSEYPCFSISFYNLYPVCGPCNRSKSTNYVDFKLYSSDYMDYRESKFAFTLDKVSLLRYRVNGDMYNLKVNFEDHGAGVKETFAIEGIYNEQKDIAEELVLKSMIYNRTYSESLKTSLNELYKGKAPMLERLMVGNYTKETDIHKRPMSKFTMDIARQLKLIK